MVGLGCAVTVAMVRAGHVPFFFRPLQFLVFDPMTVFTFAGLTTAAIVMRRRTEWHRRLHYCGMSMLLGPAFGRLLPMPLISPWSWEAAFAATLIFPVIGIIADKRRTGTRASRLGARHRGDDRVADRDRGDHLQPGRRRAVSRGHRGLAGRDVAPLDFAPPPAGSA